MTIKIKVYPRWKPPPEGLKKRFHRVPDGWDMPYCECGGPICPVETGARIQAAVCTYCHKKYELEFMVLTGFYKDWLKPPRVGEAVLSLRW